MISNATQSNEMQDVLEVTSLKPKLIGDKHNSAYNSRDSTAGTRGTSNRTATQIGFY